ncbi:hypothetical protein BGX27_002505 [Mortierella sp. AM989]|nr:hypothetical protein BGX27_002505 [Mortierella sp. AM989]
MDVEGMVQEIENKILDGVPKAVDGFENIVGTIGSRIDFAYEEAPRMFKAQYIGSNPNDENEDEDENADKPSNGNSKHKHKSQNNNQGSTGGNGPILLCSSRRCLPGLRDAIILKLSVRIHHVLGHLQDP